MVISLKKYCIVYDHKRAHQPTRSRNALVLPSFPKILQNGSCAVLSNKHQYYTFIYQPLSKEFVLKNIIHQKFVNSEQTGLEVYISRPKLYLVNTLSTPIPFCLNMTHIKLFKDP